MNGIKGRVSRLERRGVSHSEKRLRRKKIIFKRKKRERRKKRRRKEELKLDFMGRSKAILHLRGSQPSN